MAGNIGTLVEHELYFPNTPIFFLNKSISDELLPAFAESPVRKGGDECEKGIHRSLLTAIASAAGVGEGGYASAGSTEDVKMPRAAARGASLFGISSQMEG